MKWKRITSEQIGKEILGAYFYDDGQIGEALFGWCREEYGDIVVSKSYYELPVTHFLSKTELEKIEHD